MRDSPPVCVPDILLQHHWGHLDDLAEQGVNIGLQVRDLLALGLDSRPLRHQQLDQVLAVSTWSHHRAMPLGNQTLTSLVFPLNLLKTSNGNFSSAGVSASENMTMVLDNFKVSSLRVWETYHHHHHQGHHWNHCQCRCHQTVQLHK